MALDNLKPADNSTHKTKRKGRGQGSGMGKTASRGSNGQKSRTGYSIKRGFEGGQQPLQRRLPKVGFYSGLVKPYVININKIKSLADLDEITMDSIRGVHKIANSVKQVKLVGKGVKEIAPKIKDENVLYSGMNR